MRKLPTSIDKLATSVDVVDAMSGVTLRVDFKRTTELWWRVKLAMWLFWMGAWVLNCNVEFDEDKDGHE